MVVASGRVPMSSLSNNRPNAFEPRSPFIDHNGNSRGRGGRGRGRGGRGGGRGGRNDPMIHKKVKIKSGTYKGFVFLLFQFLFF